MQNTLNISEFISPLENIPFSLISVNTWLLEKIEDEVQELSDLPHEVFKKSKKPPRKKYEAYLTSNQKDILFALKSKKDKIEVIDATQCCEHISLYSKVIPFTFNFFYSRYLVHKFKDNGTMIFTLYRNSDICFMITNSFSEKIVISIYISDNPFYCILKPGINYISFQRHIINASIEKKIGKKLVVENMTEFVFRFMNYFAYFYVNWIDNKLLSI